MDHSREEIEELVRQDLGLTGEMAVGDGGSGLAASFSYDPDVPDEGLIFLDRSEGDPEAILGMTLPATDGEPTTERYAVQWRFRGRHTATLFGGSTDDYIGPTGNEVEIEGVTIVDFNPNRDVQFMRYIDWLSAYVQIGIVEMRRPASIDLRNAEDVRIAPVVGWPSLQDEEGPSPLPVLPIGPGPVY